MKKENLVKIINQNFNPLGFVKKGNSWVFEGNQITKVIDMQKSQFGDQYYLNYGYSFNSIPLEGAISHVYKRVNQKATYGQEDFDGIVQEINDINSEEDLVAYMKSQPHLNDIPLNVKSHFNLMLK